MIASLLIVSSLRKEENACGFYALEVSWGNLGIFCGVEIAKFGCKLSTALVRNQSDPTRTLLHPPSPHCFPGVGVYSWNHCIECFELIEAFYLICRNPKIILDGGQWRWWCLGSCTSKSMEAWRVENFPVLFGQKYSPCCLQMDWNFRFGMPVCSAGFLSSGVLHYFLWCGYLCIEFVDWVLVTSRWSWAGTFWWAISANKRFGWVQAIHSPPAWVQVLVIVLPFVTVFNLFV